MAIMFPKAFPHDLKVKPRLAGEKIAFETLAAGLEASWSVFYDRPVRLILRAVRSPRNSEGRKDTDA